MRFRRSTDSLAPTTPTERLVRRTAVGLAVTTLTLIAMLLAAVGIVTAAVAIRTTDENVDRSLRDAAAAIHLEVVRDAAGNEQLVLESGAGETNTGETGGSGESDRLPEFSDTFFLVLDADGGLLLNPQRIALNGLPDTTAAMAALDGGDDWRTVDADGVRVRLLTQRVVDPDGQPVGFLQAGFVMTLHDAQARQILMTILVSSLIGLIGAALVTLLVTRLALAPIRTAFAAERRFVAAASHELRTPVAVMRASAEILQREELVKPDGQRLVGDVIAETDRLGRLIGDLLALASADAGQISVQPRPIELRAFVGELVQRVTPLALQRDVDLAADSTAIDRDVGLWISADPDRLTQLLLIFIDNAIDHSPPGGTVTVVARPITERGRPAASVDVVDQGPGVPVAERERIFEPFARLAGRPRATANTGLGLAVARVLASRQGAALRVGDAPGGGAVFSVVLPRLRRLQRHS